MNLFGTAGIRGDAAAEVTPSFALAVGRAAAADGPEFVVGRDGRETASANDGVTSVAASPRMPAVPNSFMSDTPWREHLKRAGTRKTTYL